MAERRGTGGRGGPGSLSEWEAAGEDEAIKPRLPRQTGPSPLLEVVKSAPEGRTFARTVPATEAEQYAKDLRRAAYQAELRISVQSTKPKNGEVRVKFSVLGAVEKKSEAVAASTP